MSFVQELLFDACILPAERQQALIRVFTDPGIPDKSTTSPFWMRDPHPQLSNCQSTSLPTEADTVIIGSGITGASIARTLLQDRSPKSHDAKSSIPSVVMLEARDVCSGATGRNGGHILETGDEFAGFVDAVGIVAARKLMRFRLRHLDTMLRVAEEWGLTEVSQARKVRFLSVYFDEETWSDALERFRVFKEGMPAESAEWTAYAAPHIPKEFNLPHAKGIVSGPAGAIWPYKFVCGILSRLRETFPSDFHIETSTPVTSIHKTGPKYTLQTPRGTILARHVIHCTNAHAGHLLPNLRGRIYSIRGQMSAQSLGDTFPDQGTKHSWVFNYPRGFDYLTQLPTAKGQMMFGGGFAQGQGGGITEVGVARDAEQSLYVDIHLSGALGAIFSREGCGAGPRLGSTVQAMWTGNMGFSADGFPWVGILPSSTAQRESGSLDGGKGGAEWISAAFSGEGMVHAWLCGEALGAMVLAGDGRLDGSKGADLSSVPEQMLVTEERVGKAVLPRVVGETELGKRTSNL